MITLQDVKGIIETKSGVNVYLGYVPENITETAIALTSVVSESVHGRDVTGAKAGISAFWRASVTGEDIESVSSVANKIAELDNTSQTGFRKLFVEIVNMESPSNTGEATQTLARIFLDIEFIR